MDADKKSESILASVVMRIRRVTGLGVLESKSLLSTASPLYRSRLELAAEYQNIEENSILHDPIEDDPEVTEIIERAEAETRIELKGEKQRRGLCHLHWKTKKKILKEKYGIDWFTPAEMNPGCRFD
jgi:hypothetical protein